MTRFSKKEQRLLSIAIVICCFFWIALLLILFGINELKEGLQEQNQLIEMRLDSSDEEPESILAEKEVDFAGAGTLNAKASTIHVDVAVTPIEFTKATTAHVKVSGKSYALKREDNRFIGGFPISAFKMTDIYLVLEDDKTVRTEYLEAMGPYLSSELYWSVESSSMKRETKYLELRQSMAMNSSDDVAKRIVSGQVVAIVDGKEVYKQDIAQKDGTISGFDLDHEIDAAENTPVDIYVEVKDRYGYTYRCYVERLPEKDAGQEYIEKGEIQVLGLDGKSILKKKMDEDATE